MVEVGAFGDHAASARIAVTATTCTDFSPTATILAPSRDITVGDDGVDTDVGLHYAGVSLEGKAVDPEDGDLSGAALVWTTNRTDLQDASLGTGASLPVRLNADDLRLPPGVRRQREPVCPCSGAGHHSEDGLLT